MFCAVFKTRLFYDDDNNIVVGFTHHELERGSTQHQLDNHQNTSWRINNSIPTKSSETQGTIIKSTELYRNHPIVPYFSDFHYINRKASVDFNADQPF
ncbi:hypothetical protein CEXT_9231 [Caerostris extrusa]|uniref:Uncharacterized protein n=1 Tax=Caerostris extrusa TaxID=172846 RepID=A0AAV4N2N4_CAEEX|nr:hypothetical protein CEXT_9231 [Caerostris extrusa]